MPIYEYLCTECGHELEKLRKLSDAPLTDCPACGKPTLKKKVSAAGFRLKGSGWYETDFKSNNRKNVAKSDNKPKSGGETSKKSSSGDSK
ncbi:hypothetical protein MNBD_GAMMA15-157 [hydrothermal vent metagenome]|uniref:Putative regulatory protein FmdB zinc ribbon domain-containing protein n=1 Tax=hydrothermal vent metagenome TaxID=652676 RepID=A0A3B0Z2W6_9ZZZZ